MEAALVFDFLQEAVVDDGAVPHEDDGGAFGGASAQGVEGGAFDDADVVFFAFVDRVAQVQVEEGLGAEVLEIDVAGGVFGAFVVAGIVGGGGVPVAVAGEELIGSELGEGGEGVDHGAGHGADEGLVGGLEVQEAAGAGEGVKEAGAGRGLREGGLEGVEKGASGGLGPEGAEETDAEVVGIGDARSVAGQLARDGDVQQGGEKSIGKGRGGKRNDHNNHKHEILTLNGASGNPGEGLFLLGV